MVSDSIGNVFVGDYEGGTIRVINSSGVSFISHLQ